VDNVRVIEGRAGARLTIKIFERLRVFRQFSLHQFDRYFAQQSGIERPINRAHASGSYRRAKLELAQLHRHHDRVTAFAARNGGQGQQVGRNEILNATPETGDHAEGLANFFV
jgi:hypothetical protein